MSDQINTHGINASYGGAQETATIIQSLLSKTHTAAIVRVEAVNPGGTGAVGRVDVLPLVRQMGADGKGIDSVTIYNLPYFRLQGGQNAVIIDPQVGDLGIAVFASRDISAVKRTKQESSPSSKRQYDLADGLYLGGFLNAAPEQYIHFKDDGGVKIVSTADFEVEAEGDIKMTAKGSALIKSEETTIDSPATKLTGTLEVAGATTLGGGGTVEGDIHITGTATANVDHVGGGVSLAKHDHGGVEAGGSTTGKPNK